MPVAVDEHELLVLAATQEEIDADPTDPETPDRLLASKAMAIRDLAEEQLILALPLAPRHARCKAAGEMQDREKVLPFAELKNMMRGRN
jgi:uncharacterized protein